MADGTLASPLCDQDTKFALLISACAGDTLGIDSIVGQFSPRPLLTLFICYGLNRFEFVLKSIQPWIRLP